MSGAPFRSSALVAVVLVLRASLAGAQVGDESLDDLDLVKLLNVEVSTATKTAESQDDAPAVITVVTQADIRRWGYETVADVLAHVQGFYLIDDHILPDTGVRGMTGGLGSESGVIKVMIDGRSVAYRTTSGNWLGDQAFGALRAGLRARGLDEWTLYVVVGDHGEAFREHPGNVAHALHLYEENVRVPFFVAAPGAHLAVRRAPHLASLIDLAPTTLALAGLPPEATHEGRSLLGAGAPRVARFFTEQAVRRWGVRDGSWKLILDADTGREELYDLANDAAEAHDVASSEPERTRRLRRCLGR